VLASDFEKLKKFASKVEMSCLIKCAPRVMLVLLLFVDDQNASTFQRSFGISDQADLALQIDSQKLSIFSPSPGNRQDRPVMATEFASFVVESDMFGECLFTLVEQYS